MRIIKLEQPSCAPCKYVGNYLEGMNIEYESIDVLANTEAREKFAIMSTPVTILLDDEENEVQRVVGFNPAELEDLISKL